jgi:hypothetical protein
LISIYWRLRARNQNSDTETKLKEKENVSEDVFRRARRSRFTQYERLQAS